ncbi:hypothetical protein [Leeia sp.]|uniref:hypothetical protein n=1 Tax=Leeia sp. TaxID=2884678 RepID=UPI0035B2F242
MKRLLLGLLAITPALASAAGAQSSCVSKQDMVSSFRQGIVLNQQFKASIHQGGEAYRRLRHDTEAFEEAVLESCMRRAVKRLTQDADRQLLHELLSVAVSFQNSASEAYSESVAELFIRSPDWLERGISSFPPADQRVLLQRLSEGWKTIQSKLPLTLIKARQTRLQRLLRAVNG